MISTLSVGASAGATGVTGSTGDGTVTSHPGTSGCKRLTLAEDRYPGSMDNGYRVAVVGATGQVGTLMLKLLRERAFPASEIVPFASERSRRAGA